MPDPATNTPIIEGTSKVTGSVIPGRYGLTGLDGNADELAAFAQTVRERTGATEVDMIGWSQGGTLINDYAKEVGGELLDDAITYGATHHGTTASGLGTLARSLIGEGGLGTTFGEGPGATVDNITLQDGCWIDRSGHLSMMYSPRAIDIAKRALDPEGDGWLRCRYNSRVP